MWVCHETRKRVPFPVSGFSASSIPATRWIGHTNLVDNFQRKLRILRVPTPFRQRDDFGKRN